MADADSNPSLSRQQPNEHSEGLYRDLKFGETLYIRLNGAVSNELVMPWSSTWKLDAIPENSDATSQLVGRSLFIYMGSEQHLQLFLRDGTDEDGPKYSVMLESDRSLGPQQIVLRAGSANQQSSKSKPRTANDYVEQVIELERLLALDSVPQGFSEDMPAKPVALRIGEINGSLVSRHSGSMFGQEWTVEKYLLVNAGNNLLELSENNFKMPGVRGIAFWELLRLKPAEKTYLMLVRDRVREGQ